MWWTSCLHSMKECLERIESMRREGSERWKEKWRDRERWEEREGEMEVGTGRMRDRREV